MSKKHNTRAMLILFLIVILTPFILSYISIKGYYAVKVQHLYSQDYTSKDSNASSSNNNDFQQQNTRHSALYIVCAVVLVIWVGISLYLFTIDRRIRKLERDIK